MFVDHLQLADFRSYAAVDVALGAGVSVFVGANGQGKTNLVEAIEYLSTLSSHRVAADLPLVRSGAERAIIRARVQAGPRRPSPVAARGGDHPRARPTAPGSTGRRCGGPGRSSACCAPWSSRRRTWPSSRATRASGAGSWTSWSSPAGPGWPACAPTTTGCCGSATPCSSPLERAVPRAAPPRGGPPAGRHARRLGQPTWRAAGGELLAARLRTLTDLAPHVSKAYADIAPTNNDATAEYKASIPLGRLRPAARSWPRCWSRR